MSAYYICLYLVSLAFAYVLAFTETTRRMGQELADFTRGASFQDAITPPQFTNAAITVYLLLLAGILFAWWQFTWLPALGITVGFLVATTLNKIVFIPLPGGIYFRMRIIRSMSRRYADYRRHGDDVRAAAMETLLRKVGVVLDDSEESETSGRQSQRANEIIDAFGQVMADVPQLIRDASVLPYPKPIIEAALTSEIDRLQRAAQNETGQDSRTQVMKRIDWLRTGLSLLSDYQEIDPEDAAAVAEVNGGSLEALERQLLSETTPAEARAALAERYNESVFLLAKYCDKANQGRAATGAAS